MKKLISTISVLLMLFTTSVFGQTNNDLEIDEFLKKMASEKYLLIDVRTAEEFAAGHIQGAINIDYYSADFSKQIGKIGKEKPILLYCRSGNRSARSMNIMYEMGFVEVKHLACGIKGWKAENRKIIQSQNEN
jgi:rhodanese-related sulfurtransferase